MTASAITRRFVKVGSRHVHYRRGGQGPPLILIHQGISHSGALVPEIERLGAHYTCFAFDNPGYGNTDPLAQTEVSIADFADALAAALRALMLPKVVMFGTHTGAAIALEVGIRHGELVAGVILDGLIMYTREETAHLYSHPYALPLTIDPLGGHFAHTWTRMRDQATFFPWYSRDPADLIAVEAAATPERIHASVQYFLYAANSYQSPFRAAHTYGEIAAQRLAEITVPCVLMVASNDGIAKHFPRYPKLPNVALHLLGPDLAEKHALIDASAKRVADPGESPDCPAWPRGSGDIDRQFIDLPSGQIHVCACGASEAPPILVLHDTPGSARSLEVLLRGLGKTHRAIAPDLPGSGESTGLAPVPTLSDYVCVMKDLLGALGVPQIAVYGIGFGSSLAVALAKALPKQVTHIALRGVLAVSSEERDDLRAHYAPPIAIDPAGHHWFRTWQMLRDSLVYWPWYNRTGRGLRRVAEDFGGERLHIWTFEVMKQIGSYHHFIHAALGNDTATEIATLRQPLLLLIDPGHSFAGMVPPAPAQAQRSTIRAGVADEVAALSTFVPKGPGS